MDMIKRTTCGPTENKVMLVDDDNFNERIHILLEALTTASANVQQTVSEASEKMVEFHKALKHIRYDDSILIKITKSQSNNWSRRKMPIYRRSNVV